MGNLIFLDFIGDYDEFFTRNDYFYVRIKFIKILWFLNLLFYLMR